MKAKDMKCQKCGRGAWQVAQRGAYLRRVNQNAVDNVPWVMECFPLCDEEDIKSKEHGFINSLADLHKDVELSDKQNEILNRISQKINRGA